MSKNKLSKKCEEAFLEKYIVGNWFRPKHLGLKKKEVEPFKKYLSELASDGWFNCIMNQVVEEFRENVQTKKKESL